MIDKIDGGSPYDYPKITNKRSAGIHAYDAAWQNAISEKEKQEDPGVILDIGANREKKQPEKEQPQSQKDRTETSGGGFTWEDAPAEEKKDPVETTDDAEQIAAQNEAWADERIEEAEKQVQMQAVLKSRNLDSLAAILSENGKKHLAKNTTLLTTYDRRGRIVAIDEAERERILHGDKNFIKL